MKAVPVVLVLAGAACELFAYWGINTVSGRRTFDEMAGMIPLAAAPLGVVLIFSGVVLGWLIRGQRGN